MACAAASGGSRNSSNESRPNYQPDLAPCATESPGCTTLLGISRKTLQNHVANVKTAVRRFAGVKRLSGRGISLAPAWKVLYDQITVPRLRLGLSSLLRYCSATAIDPSSVSEATVAAFITYASQVQFTVKPNDLRKQVTRCWNQAKERVPRKCT
jgi:hypothetical protein